MATNYSKNPGQMTDGEQDQKTVGIVLSVIVAIIVLLRLLCFCVQKDREEQDARAGNRVRQQRQSSETGGGWADRVPSATVPGAAVEVAPVLAAEPPLVCTYREADGWRDGSCGVCLAELDDGDVLRVVPTCMHYFDAACIGEWLRGHDTCPLCRASLVGPAAAA